MRKVWGLSIYDNETRLADHFMGQLHIGYGVVLLVSVHSQVSLFELTLNSEEEPAASEPAASHSVEALPSSSKVAAAQAIALCPLGAIETALRSTQF